MPITATNNNKLRSSNGAHSANGKSNGAVVKSKTPTTATQSNGHHRNLGNVEEQAEALLTKVRTTILKKFGVKIQLREKRLQTKIGHATKEKVGLDIAAQLKKRGKTMNWQRWNNEVFPTLFGQPDALRHDVEVIALVMAKLYDVFELDPQEAIKGLVKFNQESLAKRNSYNKQDEDEIDDIENELDSDEDEEAEESEEDLEEDEEDFDTEEDEDEEDSDEDEEEDLE